MKNQKLLAIIAVSVVVSTLILPLYRKADAMQEAEREKQEQMEHSHDEEGEGCSRK